MTRDALVDELAAIERLFADRITVVRIVVDPDGRELYRISRTFQPPRTNDTPQKETQ